MSNPAPKKKKRENSKTRVWEKERRDRLNDYFKKLWEVLPMYDASKPLSKPDVLIHAATTIKELDEKLKTLLANSEGEKASEVKFKVSADLIKKLQDRLKKLLLRNEQLANLLRTTGIKIPSECGTVKKIKKSPKYSNVVSADQQAKLLQQESEKENKAKNAKPKTAKPKPKSKSPFVKSKRRLSKKALLSSNCLFVVSQPNFQSNSCFILSKPNRKHSQTVLTNSLFVKSPLVSPQVKPSSLPTASQLFGLGPGSLVFANGTVMPLFPHPRPLPILPSATPTPLSTLIIVSTKNSTNPSAVAPTDSKVALKDIASASKVKHLPALQPRANITQTTQVNKVPIPALTSKYSKQSCFGAKNGKNAGESVKGQSRKKPAGSDKSLNEAKRFKSGSVDPQAKESKSDAASEVEKVNDDLSKTDNSEKVTGNGGVISELSQFTTDAAAVSESSVIPETACHIGEATTATTKMTENLTSVLSSQTNVKIDNPFQLCPETTANPITSENFVLSELDHPVDALHPPAKEPAKDSKQCLEEQCHKTSADVLNPELQNVEIHQHHSGNLNDLKSLEMHLPQNELSNDIFASFQVPPGCQNQESTSPTAAFLLAFPLVSSGTKVAEAMGEDNSESQAGTPNLLQIGTIDIAKPTQSYSDSLTPNLLNFDSFSFFGAKEPCNGFYNACGMATGKNINNFAGGNFGQGKSKASGDHKFAAVAQYKSEVNSDGRKQIHSGALHSGSNKFSNYHGSVAGVKEPTGAGNKMQGVMQGNSSNTVDISSDIFSFKTPVNDNYSTKNCSVGNSYSNKFPCNYSSNYKNCSNSTVNSHQFMDGSKQYAPVYTSASAANNSFFNTFATDDYNVSEAYSTEFHNRKSNYAGGVPQVFHKEKVHENLQQQKPKPVTQGNKLINWMTTPNTTAASCKTDYFLPPAFPATNSTFTNTVSSNTYFNSSVYPNANDHFSHQDFSRKSGDMYASTDENQFTWSPSKMPQFLDTQTHPFVPSTLPTLVGDLALNTTSAVDNKTYKERVRDSGNNSRNNRKVAACDNQNHSTFFSVSQLVENQETGPAKIASRRSSGNRTKAATPKSSKKSAGRPDSHKEALGAYQKADKSGFNISVASNLFSGDVKQPSRSNSKNIRQSYSAEALIGNQGPSEPSGAHRNNLCPTNSTNKAQISNFLNDNLYFPSIEVSQDNSSYPSQNYHHSNAANFAQHFTTTFHNGGYPSNNFTSTISSAYMPSNTFMSTGNTQDFLSDSSNLFQNNSAPLTATNKDKCNFPAKNYYKPSDKVVDKNQSYNCKKAKKRPVNDNVLPSFDIHFLSMPGAVNSPILPDDFHTTYLASNSLYPGKNPLYSKPNSDTLPNTLIHPLHSTIPGGRAAIQHPQMSPSVNSAGTTLTNFNLSTICPEIDKGLVQETFPESRSKDYNAPTKSFANTSSHHIGSLPFV